jgi:hypothetical protein
MLEACQMNVNNSVGKKIENLIHRNLRVEGQREREKMDRRREREGCRESHFYWDF